LTDWPEAVDEAGAASADAADATVETNQQSIVDQPLQYSSTRPSCRQRRGVKLDPEVQSFDLSAAHQLELRDLTDDSEVAIGQLRSQLGEASATEAIPAHEPPPSIPSVGAVDAEAKEKEVRRLIGATGRHPPGR